MLYYSEIVVFAIFINTLRGATACRRRRSCVFEHKWWFNNITHLCGTQADWVHHDKQHSARFVLGVIVNVSFALVCCVVSG